MKPNPLKVAPTDTLAEVSKKMAKKGKDIIIVEEDGVVRGLVTASDIYFAMKSYVLGKDMLESVPMEIRDIQISELMKTPPRHGVHGGLWSNRDQPVHSPG